MNNKSTNGHSRLPPPLSSPLRQAKILKTSNTRHVPFPTGQLKTVGYRDFLLGHSRQTGLLVRLFYPTSSSLPTDPKRWPKWLAHENYVQGLLEVVGVQSRIISAILKVLNPMNKVHVPAVENGDFLPPAKEPYPLIVFSHGLGGTRFLYSTFCLEFASRGFVVAAIEHRDNSAALSFYYRPKGTISPENEQHIEPEVADPKYRPPRPFPPIPIGTTDQELVWIRHRYVSLLDSSDNNQVFRYKQVQHRAAECSRAVDFLQNLNAGGKLIENLLDPKYSGEEFKGCLNLQKLIVMGNSFGGATVMLAALNEPRFKVAVSFDGWAFPLQTIPLNLVQQPVLHINTETLGTEAKNVEKFSEIFKNTADPQLRQSVIITGSIHMQQCDAMLASTGRMMKRMARRLDPKSPPAVDTFDVHDLTTAKALQFIGQHLDLKVDDDIELFLRDNEGAFRATYE